VLKATAHKIRKLKNGVIVGSPVSTADAFSLLETLRRQARTIQSNCAAPELSWLKNGMDRALPRLEAMVVARQGSADFCSPARATSSSRRWHRPPSAPAALRSRRGPCAAQHNQAIAEADRRRIAQGAATICIYTNSNVVVEEI